MATQTTKEPATKTMPAKTVDDYLAAAPKDKRAALMKLRKTIKAAAPKATEGLWYGMVGFKQNRKPVAYLAYWKTHLALYGTMSGSFIEAHAAELKAYDLGKGMIQFTADKPPSERLLTKIVKARIAEIEKRG